MEEEKKKKKKKKKKERERKHEERRKGTLTAYQYLVSLRGGNIDVDKTFLNVIGRTKSYIS